jgi:MinD superfamily P-loop ATPase
MIISVASGKGGTGKTLVATSLARSLIDTETVQVIDCDVEEPNDHVFLKPIISSSTVVNVPVPKIDIDKCTHCGKCAEVCAYNAIAVIGKHVLTFAQLCHGCGACNYLCPEKAITEAGRKAGLIEQGNSDGIKFAHGILTIGEAMAPPVIKKVKDLAIKDAVIIVDVPPGTSCPVVEAVKGSDFCLLVTEPTPFGLNDLALAVATVRELGIPCGIVLNRTGIGSGEVEEYCQKVSVPILLKIPLDTEIASLYSRGITLADGIPQWQNEFRQLFDKIKELS